MTGLAGCGGAGAPGANAATIGSGAAQVFTADDRTLSGILSDGPLDGSDLGGLLLLTGHLALAA
ncbi:MAG: hypothetical protein GEV07_14580 [Streptosporangiales bacterium]|nr:hypothetical protein [Streptosporangiales bacterium]